MKPTLLPLLLLPVSALAQQNTRPNVILLYADDLGYGDLSCYGADRVSTPNIDKMAAEGTRFTRAYAAAATSTPSRYAILTGEYAWRKPGTDVAAGDAGMIIKPEQFSMADLFRQAGYHTAAIGKWHLGLGERTGEQDWNNLISPALVDLGFDYSYIMAATSDRVPCVFIQNGRVANYDPTAPIQVSYKANFPGEPTGRSHPELLYNLRPSHGHDMSIVNGISRIGYMKGGGKALWKDENIADSIADHAQRFIREQSEAGQPFFLYLATNDVHVPRFPHSRFRGRSPMGLRGDAIQQFDWTVGQILHTLDSLKLSDNTLILLSSDNGPVVDDGYADNAEQLLGTHSPTGHLRGAKYSAFEGGTRVPLIVRWPKRTPSGKVSKALVSQIDFFASFADLLGLPLNQEQAPDSRPQLASLLGQSKKGAPYVVQQAADKTLSICTDRWKFIEPSKHGPMVTWGPKIETGYLPSPQLYDMRKDEHERQNIAERQPKEVQRLQTLLKTIRQQSSTRTIR